MSYWREAGPSSARSDWAARVQVVVERLRETQRGLDDVGLFHVGCGFVGHPLVCRTGQGHKKAPSGMAPEGAKFLFAQAPRGAHVTDTTTTATTEE